MKNQCPGSGTRTGGWPGDQDVCPICEAWVTVKQDDRLRSHRSNKRGEERMAARATQAAAIAAEKQAERDARWSYR